MAAIKRKGYPTLFEREHEGDFEDWYCFHANQSDYNTTVPAVNEKETDKNLLIEMAAPGMHKKDFRIHQENDRWS